MPLPLDSYSYSDLYWQYHNGDKSNTVHASSSNAHRLSQRIPNPWTNPFPLSQSDVRTLIAAVLAETLVYGIHVILYLFSSSVLIRKGGRMQLVSLAATTVMFMLATADVGVSYAILLNHYTDFLFQSKDTMFLFLKLYPKFLFHLANNLIADTLLITRCFFVWGNNRIVGCGAVLLLVTGTVMGFISEGTVTAKYKYLISGYILVIFILNLSLTILTAGRIWWIAREVGKIMGRQVTRPYNLAVGILLESGFIYTCGILCVFILLPTPWILIAATVCARLVCIMPIFIVVQVALGRGAKSLENSVSAARSGEVQFSTGLLFRTTDASGMSNNAGNTAAATVAGDSILNRAHP